MTATASNRIAGVLMALILVIFAVATYWSISLPGDDVTSPTPTAPATAHYVPDEVRRLISFVDSARADGTRSHDREFAATGVEYVAAALAAVASSSGLNI